MVKKYDAAVKLRQKNINKENAKSHLKGYRTDIESQIKKLDLNSDNYTSQLPSIDEMNQYIDNAEDEQIISQYKDSANQGMQAILEQAQLQSDKNTAIAKANQHRDNQKRAIDQMLGLSDSDKNDLNNQINALVADNSGAISGTKSNEQITSLVADNNAAIEKNYGRC
ncbi:hypothetical protein [Holzapfeliella floricola]|uniref:hypothetical protein n=1 Tax=Holzapfeliella floricola TaxID=679249 RepID=UPI000784FFD8|nr:hypothetical protein [Holzapfeliella floricola]